MPTVAAPYQGILASYFNRKPTSDGAIFDAGVEPERTVEDIISTPTIDPNSKTNVHLPQNETADPRYAGRVQTEDTRDAVIDAVINGVKTGSNKANQFWGGTHDVFTGEEVAKWQPHGGLPIPIAANQQPAAVPANTNAIHGVGAAAAQQLQRSPRGILAKVMAEPIQAPAARGPMATTPSEAVANQQVSVNLPAPTPISNATPSPAPSVGAAPVQAGDVPRIYPGASGANGIGKVVGPDAFYGFGDQMPKGGVAVGKDGVPLDQTMVPVQGNFSDPRTQVKIGILKGGPSDVPGAAFNLPADDPNAVPHGPGNGVRQLSEVSGATGANPSMNWQLSQAQKDAAAKYGLQTNALGIMAPMYRAPLQAQLNATAQQLAYDQVVNRLANDENARRIALQGEVNKGVMAQQQAKENIARISGDSRVKAADVAGQHKEGAAEVTGKSREKAAEIAADSRIKGYAMKGDTEKAKIELAKQHQDWLESGGVEMAQQKAVEQYNKTKGEMIKSGASKKQLSDLDASYAPYLQPPQKRPAGRSAAPATGPVPAQTPVPVWNNTRPRVGATGSW